MPGSAGVNAHECTKVLLMGSENRAAILAAMPDASKEAVAGSLPTDTAEALGLVVASSPVAVVEKAAPTEQHGTQVISSLVPREQHNS